MWHSFNGCDEFDGDPVDVCVMGAPFDLASTHTAGQRLAPQAIREAGVWPNGYSRKYDSDWVNDLTWADFGDVRLPQGDALGGMDSLTRQARALMKKCGTLVTLGGDHAVSLAVLRAYKRAPVVIHFDAHADYEPREKDALVDHGSWVHDALIEGLADAVLQFGVRGWGYTKETTQQAEALGVIGFNDPPDDKALRALVRDRPVHLSVDLDVCDPCYAPGVAYQEPGGWTSRELMDAVFVVARNCDMKGLDVTEVIPDRDPTLVTCRLANRVVVQAATGLACQRRQNREHFAS